MLYRIAYDTDSSNPNPHAWELAGHHSTYEDAVQYAEEEDAMRMRDEGYTSEELSPWIIVKDGSGPATDEEIERSFDAYR